MGILNSLDFLSVLPWPEVKCLVLRTRDDKVSDGVIEDRNCVFMLSELWNSLFGGDVPHDCVSIPRAWYEVICVDETQGIDVAIVLDHPDWCKVNIIANDLAIYESCNGKQSFVWLEWIDSDAENIFFDGVAWRLRD